MQSFLADGVAGVGGAHDVFFFLILFAPTVTLRDARARRGDEGSGRGALLTFAGESVMRIGASCWLAGTCRKN